jgi:hypothetical protein
MPPRASDATIPLSAAEREVRKKYLALACACDRVELALIWKKRSEQAAGPLGALISNPWISAAASLLTPLLPRKLRVASFLFRLWKRRH